MRKDELAIQSSVRPFWSSYFKTALLLFISWAAMSTFALAQSWPRSFREAVTIDVETQVVKTLETAREHIAAEQWEPAVSILQELIDSGGETLVPVEPGRYVNSSDYCHLLVSQLPAAGLDVYRHRTDAQAKGWFETGRRTLDEAVLLRIIDSAFNSSYGDDALWLLGELAFERGRFALARQYWSLLVPSVDPNLAEGVEAQLAVRSESQQLNYLIHPDPSVSRENVLARLILCSIFEGDKARVQQELSICRGAFPEAVGTLAGRSGKLVEILDELVIESGHWQDLKILAGAQGVPGGRVNRNALLRATPRTDELVWRRSLPRNRFTGPSTRPLLDTDRSPSCFPLYHDDTVYVCGSDSVYAFDVKTGLPKWPVDNNDDGRIFTNILERPVTPHLPSAGQAWYALSLSDGRLYARLGPPVVRRSRNEVNAFSELVGLDIAQREGELVFHVTSDVLDPEAESPEATSWSFEGAPVVADGRVYVSARRGFPEDETLVACFDANSSRLLWRRHVCSSLKNASEQFNLIGQNLLTLGDGRLFLATGTGAIAALDAANGRLLWVVTYESNGEETSHELSDPRRHGLAPCLFHQGIVYAAPDDSDLLLALDATTGQPFWRQRFPDPVLHIVGVVEGRLILSGKSVWAVEAGTGLPAWPERIGFADPAGRGFGRPALSPEFLYWPTRDEILKIDHRRGRISGRIQLREDFGMSGGNLVIADGKLLIAHPTGLVALGAVARKVFGEGEASRGASSPAVPMQPGGQRTSVRNVKSWIQPVSFLSSDETASTENLTATTASSLWPVQRAWRVLLPEDAVVRFPQDSTSHPSSGPIVTADGQLQLLDQSNGQPRWSVHVESEFDDVVVLRDSIAFSGSDAVVARSLQDGRLLWRHLHPDTGTRRTAFMRGVGGSQFVHISESQLLSLDSDTGTTVWNWPNKHRLRLLPHLVAARYPSDWCLAGEKLLYRPTGSAEHSLVDLYSGRIVRQGKLTLRVSNLLDTSTESSGDRLAMIGHVPGHRIRMTRLAELGSRWEYKVLGHSHGRAKVLSDGRVVVVVEDSQFATRLDVETGQSRWRRPLSDTPLADVATMTALEGSQLFAITDYVARAFSLDDGSQNWQTHLGTGTWQIRVAGEVLICIHTASVEESPKRTAPRSRIAILDIADGRLLQRLKFTGPLNPAEIGIGKGCCIVREGSDLIGFLPWPTTSDVAESQ